MWDGSAWVVQYRDDGCPKLFTSAQAAFPLHSGGVRDRLYYGDPSITTGRESSGLPFLGPRKLIHAEGYIDDYHFLTPTGSQDLQAMYITITDGAIAPISVAAILVNP